ncbi:hypothetical protein JOB18_026252 [Solea senegalensis]|uniref:SWIM-type domain-containing protein n=1 Tax=Solea senegalensis TaxID=28829 RepID=A0AAV6S655_SOLSE|nr:hypothetical protein JOB18_026252 [Solea senegalensis]
MRLTDAFYVESDYVCATSVRCDCVENDLMCTHMSDMIYHELIDIQRHRLTSEVTTHYNECNSVSVFFGNQTECKLRVLHSHLNVEDQLTRFVRLKASDRTHPVKLV